MLRLLAMLAISAVVTLGSVDRAEARWFEPQTDWLHSGQLCVASREPAGRRWAAMPPRACDVVTATVTAAAEVREVKSAPLAAVKVVLRKPAPQGKRPTDKA